MRTQTEKNHRLEAPEGCPPDSGVGGASPAAAKGSGSATGSAVGVDVVAIDGPAGAGKSTVSTAVAEALGFEFLNTGLFYRAVTWRVLEDGLEQSPEDWTEGLSVSIDGGQVVVRRDGREDRIPEADLRQRTTGPLLSELSRRSSVREFLLPEQRRYADGRPLVVEGRDTGSVVFPDARWKVFLVASLEERALRRQRQEARSGGEPRSLDQIRCEIACRDSIDFCREHAPLRRPVDAYYLDSSELELEAVVQRIVDHVRADAARGAR